MKIAYICTNLFNMDEQNKTGSGIFNFILLNSLSQLQLEDLDIRVFASGDSKLPFPIESVAPEASAHIPQLLAKGKHVMYELALISKAISLQSEFDLYHVNIGDGDLVVPFSPFTDKPILITLHNIINEDFTRRYFSFFEKQKNLHFISASHYQRQLLPNLNYAANIYHGIDIEQFSFDRRGGERMMWAGRLIPGKGPDIAIAVAQALGRDLSLFGIVKAGYEEWQEQNVNARIVAGRQPALDLNLDFERARLPEQFRQSKLFILPTLLEEAFGFVYAEAMASGTPVITFARGSAPELIIDGVTGFLVNPGDDDIRGNWLTKKSGLNGLIEAAEKIYALPENEYLEMRKACRQHAEANFSAKVMAERYAELYQQIAKQ